MKNWGSLKDYEIATMAKFEYKITNVIMNHWKDFIEGLTLMILALFPFKGLKRIFNFIFNFILIK